MTCSRCQRQFRDGQLITARVISVYHEIPKPDMDQFKYAIERPHACSDIQHMCCED